MNSIVEMASLDSYKSNPYHLLPAPKFSTHNASSAQAALISPSTSLNSHGSAQLLTVSPELVSASVRTLLRFYGHGLGIQHSADLNLIYCILYNQSVLYGFSIAYLIAPGTFDSQHVIEVISGLPEGVKYAGKVILAAPFAFHSLNGIRHLSWDLTKCE